MAPSYDPPVDPPHDAGPRPALNEPATAPAWRDIRNHRPAHVYPAGITLFEQGNSATDVYYIESGLVKQFHSNPDGTDLILGLRFPGWFLGASALILGRHNVATATTLARSGVFHIPGDEFLRYLKTDAQLSWQIHQQHAIEVIDLVLHVAQLGTLSSRTRLESVFRELILTLHAGIPRGEIRLPLPLKHWELARLIAVTPEHLSRLLKQMQGDGLIRRDKGRVIVLDFEKLAISERRNDESAVAGQLLKRRRA